jgi:hypothetical protein
LPIKQYFLSHILPLLRTVFQLLRPITATTTHNVLMLAKDQFSVWDVTDKKKSQSVDNDRKDYLRSLLIGLTIGALCSGVALAAVITLFVRVKYIEVFYKNDI